MSSYVDATSGPLEYCQEMAGLFPDLAENYYGKIESYCRQKLWHQLTVIVLEFVSDDHKSVTLRATEGQKSNTFLGLYSKVVSVVAKKINQLSLARIAAAVAFCSLEDGSTTSLDESKKRLQDLLDKLEQESSNQNNNNNTAAVLYLQSKISLLDLQADNNDSSESDNDTKKEKLDKIYTVIKENGPLLKQLVSDTPEAVIVNSAHYETSMTYYKIVGPPEAFYNEAVDYLNYYQPKEGDAAATDTKSQTLAIDLCLAALTGEGVYNLGQVVSNPILKVLEQTPQAWLVDLLRACARGNVKDFKKLCQETYPAQIASQPALVNMGTQMQEKITLLGLIELVFAKPATERNLAFAEIAEGLEIPLEQVEWVIMRAFSVNLMEGIMDQVEESVHVTWILPRALSAEQMTDLAGKFGTWAVQVTSTKELMEETDICPQ
uniref:PCI domain-containing protein n=1 Tax=Pseudo-nitzschia australis TaxID=44445 RepID=A0A7S4ADL7_9STRA|mmetsp:Transcript_17025/g.37196  ORF Transcript_17025/g.37196 Transcript_17025/m.37196 type:complete len:435 (+) Transcript_17025:52-1356(+)|eukprot:CAMPEP_0168174676 /NCGR_PEP_ID=MMETSP0139_2-20121125/6653_1 /TAXON_ID=44445 /ORGANISM="Pseudo-nitzschia australis, Strain 10249 10 AB" /LENGTH=434 /DNA_ID=CAMNT_0008092887 /DNA_START=67 /DNA_END=1371 /DNA_ORIENTATION=+